uniref:Uncharacterized protein n=1 Tax=Acrobeloides nanus TaxID=290746 RepID=A0A914EH95_9BILA
MSKKKREAIVALQKDIRQKTSKNCLKFPSGRSKTCSKGSRDWINQRQTPKWPSALHALRRTYRKSKKDPGIKKRELSRELGIADGSVCQ